MIFGFLTRGPILNASAQDVRSGIYILNKQLKIHLICDNRNIPSFFRRQSSLQRACHLRSRVGVIIFREINPRRYREKWQYVRVRYCPYCEYTALFILLRTSSSSRVWTAILIAYSGFCAARTASARSIPAASSALVSVVAL